MSERTIDRLTKRTRTGLLVVLAISAMVRAPAAASIKPLSVMDALGTLSLAGRSPLQLSPDGLWVAYTVENPRRRESSQDRRYRYYTRTGAFLEALGCDVWITNTRNGETRNLTGSTGTSWDPTWSPDGRQLAFYSDRGGTARLWIWDRPTDRFREIPDAIVRPFFNFETPRWSPDGRSILFKSLPEDLTIETAADLTTLGAGSAGGWAPGSDNEAGKPTARVYRAAAASTAPEVKPSSEPREDLEVASISNRYLADLTLVDAASGSVRRVARRVKPLSYWFSPDGATIAFTTYSGTTRNTQQNHYDLRLLTIANGESRTLVRDLQMGYGISVSWSPDGKALAYITSGPRADGDCYVVPVDGGQARRVTTVKHPSFADDHRAPLWDSSGRHLYFLGGGALWRAATTDDSTRELTRIPDWSIREVISPHGGGRFWSPDNGRHLFVVARHADSKQMGIFTIETESGRATHTVTSASVFGGIFKIDAVQRGVVYAIQDAQHPEELWFADANFSNARRLTHINPQLDSYVFGSSRLIDWRNADGETLQGALLLPAGYQAGTRYPLVVRVYGGSLQSNGINRFGLEGATVDNMQMLATRGYAVLYPDMPVRPGTPMRDIAKAVLPGIDRVVELGIADPDRLAVMGHSYGGYSTLALIVQSTRFKAAVVSAGQGDLFSHYSVMAPDGGAFGIGWSETGQGGMQGTPWQFRDRYLENSPFFYLDRVDTPVLLIHGALDRPQLADQIFVALRRLGKEVEYARYEGEEHWQGTWSPANVIDYWDRTVAWLDRHVKNGK